MSADKPSEISSLNDQPLGDQELEDVAGGTDCGTFKCGTYSEQQQEFRDA